MAEKTRLIRKRVVTGGIVRWHLVAVPDRRPAPAVDVKLAEVLPEIEVPFTLGERPDTGYPVWARRSKNGPVFDKAVAMLTMGYTIDDVCSALDTTVEKLKSMVWMSRARRGKPFASVLVLLDAIHNDQNGGDNHG